MTNRKFEGRSGNGATGARSRGSTEPRQRRRRKAERRGRTTSAERGGATEDGQRTPRRGEPHQSGPVQVHFLFCNELIWLPNQLIRQPNQHSAVLVIRRIVF